VAGIQDRPFVETVDGVLSEAECLDLIARIEALGPSDAPITTTLGFEYRPDVRNNSRVIFDDPDLAERLFSSIRSSIPKASNGMTAVGANERLRCYRYEPGQYFAPHYDGSFARNDHEWSRLTLMVYLNDVEEGGETRFPTLPLTVRPSRGQALIFDHGILHESRPVRAGVKYAVRSDVMFKDG